MEEFNHYERAVIHLLAHIETATVNMISEELGISWATAKKTIKSLLDEDIVISFKDGAKTFWLLKRDLLDKDAFKD